MDAVEMLNDGEPESRDLHDILSGNIKTFDFRIQAGINHTFVQHALNHDLTDEEIGYFWEYTKQLNYIDVIYILGAIVVIALKSENSDIATRILKSNIQMCEKIVASLINRTDKNTNKIDKYVNEKHATEKDRYEMIAIRQMYANDRNPYLIAYNAKKGL